MKQLSDQFKKNVSSAKARRTSVAAPGVAVFSTAVLYVKGKIECFDLPPSRFKTMLISAKIVAVQPQIPLQDSSKLG